VPPLGGIRQNRVLRTRLFTFNLRNTSPKYLRSCPYNVFLRILGMNTTWYLHSHLVWLRLSSLSISDLLFVCLAAHDAEFPRWTPLNVELLLPPRQSRGVSPLD
jgi:hypothetical protein